jgi:4-amino-4-deoxy-L-arabinose transferase-like glycosyltransferase
MAAGRNPPRESFPTNPGKRLPRWILLAALLALALRLAFAFGYWVDEPLTRDEREYLALAGLTTGTADPFGRAPGYPIFLAIVSGGRASGDDVPASVKVAQSIVGALGVLVVAALARRLAGERAGVAAAFLAAIHPPLVAVSARAFSEALFWPLGLTAAWLFDRALDERGRTPGARHGWVCGLVSGLAILVRPGLVLWLPLAAGWALWRRRPWVAAACLCGVAVMLAPETIRNYGQYGRVVIVATEGGVTFWTGNHPLARGDGDLATNPDLARAKQALRAQHPDLSEEQMEPVYYREALGWIVSQPLHWLGLEARKLFYLVVPVGPSYQVHSARYYAASAMPYVVMLALAIIGLRRVAAARTSGLWLLLASSIVTSLVFFPSERFRIPVIDPALIVTAGAALAGRGTARAPS